MPAFLQMFSSRVCFFFKVTNFFQSGKMFWVIAKEIAVLTGFPTTQSCMADNHLTWWFSAQRIIIWLCARVFCFRNRKRGGVRLLRCEALWLDSSDRPPSISSSALLCIYIINLLQNQTQMLGKQPLPLCKSTIWGHFFGFSTCGNSSKWMQHTVLVMLLLLLLLE